MAHGEGKGGGSVGGAGRSLPPIVTRLAVPLAAVVGFGAQFLVSLRVEKPWATILPGVLLYLVALALLLVGLRAGGQAGAARVPPGTEGAAEPANPDRWLRGRAEWWLLAILLFGALWLRLYRVDVIPWGLNNDEAINAIEANEIAAGKTFATVTERGLNRETMFHLLAAWSYQHPEFGLNILRALPALFGLNPHTINDPLSDATFPVRAPSIFVAMLTLVALYVFARATFGIRVALVAAFFLAVSPWHLLYSRVGERTILAPLFMLITCSLFLRALRTGRVVDHALWGVALGLGFWTYTTFRAVPIALALFWVWHVRRRRAGWNLKPLLAGAGLAAAGFLFVMLFSGMSPFGFLLRGAYATTPPKANWLGNLFHAVTMTHFYPSDYAVIQSDAFISDGISTTYGLIGLEPDTLLLAAFSTLGLALLASTVFSRRGAGRAAAATGPDPSQRSDAAALVFFLLLATWLTIGWLGPSLTRLLMILPCLVLGAAFFTVRVWDDIAALRPPITAWIGAGATAALMALACAQGFSNMFLLAGRSERAMQNFGATQTIMGAFVKALPPDQNVIVLHTLRVDTLKFLIGARPRTRLLTDTRSVSLDDIVKTPNTVTWVVEYARPFAEPLRALMSRFPQGDMSQVADARVDPDKPLFFTFTLWKDAQGNIVAPADGGIGAMPQEGMAPGAMGEGAPGQPSRTPEGMSLPAPVFPGGPGQPPPGGSPPPPPH